MNEITPASRNDFLVNLRLRIDDFEKVWEDAKEIIDYCDEQERLKAAYAEPAPPKPKGCGCAEWQYAYTRLIWDAGWGKFFLSAVQKEEAGCHFIHYCPFCGKKLEEKT